MATVDQPCVIDQQCSVNEDMYSLETHPKLLNTPLVKKPGTEQFEADSEIIVNDSIEDIQYKDIKEREVILTKSLKYC